MGPAPSMGWPSALTTRPIMASPTGTDTTLPVRLTMLPSLMPASGAQQNDGNGIFLQVQGHAVFAVLKLHQLVRHALFQPVGAGDAVAHHDDGAGLALLDGIFVMLDLRTDDLGDLFRFQLHLCLFTTQFLKIISGGNSFCALPRFTEKSNDRRNIPAQGGQDGSARCRPARCLRYPAGCRPAPAGSTFVFRSMVLPVSFSSFSCRLFACCSVIGTPEVAVASRMPCA